MIRLATACLGLLLLAACASAPLRDPNYASTIPPAPAPMVANNGAIYQAGYAVPLFEDIKARRVGDVLTIRLVERTNASKKASTSIDKKSDLTIANPTLFGKPLGLPGGRTLETGLASDNQFEGSGDSSQSNSLSGEITVTVAHVFPNGNLLVRGEKLLTLNQGDEHVQISGIVRPNDVSPDNVVQSPRVADVQITYEGRGAVADANVMGWLARFFISALWPF